MIFSQTFLVTVDFVILAFVRYAVAQQLVINKISIPDSDVVAGSHFQSFVNLTVPSGFSYNDHPGSFELLSGSKESPKSSVVVDIMAVNQGTSTFGCSYIFPQSLPAGIYHFRVNVTNSTTSARSDAFQVTAAAFDCIPPPTWTNIASTSDPTFKSFRFMTPQAGDVYGTRLGNSGDVVLAWDYLDRRNNFSAGISNLVFEYVNFKTGMSTGVHRIAEPTLSSTFPFSGTNISPGGWRIRANYSNKFEGSPPGSTVTYMSEEFFIANDMHSKCDGIVISSEGKGTRRSSQSQRLRYVLLPLFMDHWMSFLWHLSS